MRMSKLLLGLFLCIATYLCQSTRPLLADSTGVLQSFRISLITPSAANKSATENPSAPRTKVSACLPGGSSCTKAGDCCSGDCEAKHNKCGR